MTILHESKEDVVSRILRRSIGMIKKPPAAPPSAVILVPKKQLAKEKAKSGYWLFRSRAMFPNGSNPILNALYANMLKNQQIDLNNSQPMNLMNPWPLGQQKISPNPPATPGSSPAMSPMASTNPLLFGLPGISPFLPTMFPFFPMSPLPNFGVSPSPPMASPSVDEVEEEDVFVDVTSIDEDDVILPEMLKEKEEATATPNEQENKQDLLTISPSADDSSEIPVNSGSAEYHPDLHETVQHQVAPEEEKEATTEGSSGAPEISKEHDEVLSTNLLFSVFPEPLQQMTCSFNGDATAAESALEMTEEMMVEEKEVPAETTPGKSFSEENPKGEEKKVEEPRTYKYYKNGKRVRMRNVVHQFLEAVFVKDRDILDKKKRFHSLAGEMNIEPKKLYSIFVLKRRNGLTHKEMEDIPVDDKEEDPKWKSRYPVLASLFEFNDIARYSKALRDLEIQIFTQKTLSELCEEDSDYEEKSYSYRKSRSRKRKISTHLNTPPAALSRTSPMKLSKEEIWSSPSSSESSGDPDTPSPHQRESSPSEAQKHPSEHKESSVFVRSPSEERLREELRKRMQDLNDINDAEEQKWRSVRYPLHTKLHMDLDTKKERKTSECITIDSDDVAVCTMPQPKSEGTRSSPSSSRFIGYPGMPLTDLDRIAIRKLLPSWMTGPSPAVRSPSEERIRDGLKEALPYDDTEERQWKNVHLPVPLHVGLHMDLGKKKEKEHQECITIDSEDEKEEERFLLKRPVKREIEEEDDCIIIDEKRMPMKEEKRADSFLEERPPKLPRTL